MNRTRLQIKPEEFKRLRLEARLSRKQLAVMSGVSFARIGHFEQGHEPGMTPETAVKLAVALRVPVDSFTEVVEREVL